jgi:hypothetical protein
VLDFFTLTVAVGAGSKSEHEHSQHHSQPSSNYLMPLRLLGDMYFHTDLAEKLLTTMSEKGKLCDLTMTIFDSSTSRLRYTTVILIV